MDKTIASSNKSKQAEELKEAEFYRQSTETCVNDSWSEPRKFPIGFVAPGTVIVTQKQRNTSFGLIKKTIVAKATKHKKTFAILSMALAGFMLMGNRSNPLTSRHLEVLHLESFEFSAPLLKWTSSKPQEKALFHALSFVGQNIERDWVHPIAGERIMPDKPTRVFGAHRDGERPAECGAGHCGVDLVGDIGTPIRAVLDGIVLRANHNPDANGGRYIKLNHGEKIMSYYMHLDTLSKGLKHGSVVSAGDVIGTLGDSDIETSPPHLHFSVATLNSAGGRLYVDPLPMLQRSRSY